MRAESVYSDGVRFKPHRNPLRYCSYCSADLDYFAATHRKSCPIVTGLYPVVDQAGCSWCGEPMNTCIHVLSKDEPGTYDCVCLGCGVLSAL